jgi:hypothetical protein
MALITFTNITLFVFFVYFLMIAKSFYEIFNPKVCDNETKRSNDCLFSIKNWQDKYSLALCILNNNKIDLKKRSQCEQWFQFDDIDLNSNFNKQLTIQLPNTTKYQNETLHSYIMLTKKSNLDLDANDFRIDGRSMTVIKILKLSKHRINETNTFINLLQEKQQNIELKQVDNNNNNQKPIIHLLNKITFNTIIGHYDWNRFAIPEEFFDELVIGPNSEYLPVLYVNPLTIKKDDYKPLNTSQNEFTLMINYEPISVGKFRLIKQMDLSLKLMKDYGIKEDQLNEITSIITDTNINVLLLTFIVAFFHLLFEFLAFKNDINFWRKRKTTVGLSVKTLAWRVFSQTVIFFHLLEEKASLLIVVPLLLSILIECWKMAKASKFNITFKSSSSWIPTLTCGDKSKAEIESNNFDTIAMKRLSYVMYPLCVCGAIYSLIYNTHKNWYSWILNSLVNGIYAFGFLFMTPQLFLNYKLKSVAHLPWKAFMYKAFTTFIDDIFAFIIVMPTTHRLACLRDDIVFIVYLYQRW